MISDGGSMEVVRGWHKRSASVAYEHVSDVGVGPDDEVYAMTRNPGQIIVHASDGRFLRSWGQGLFSDQAHGITVTQDRVFCADAGRHVVRVFTRTGEEVAMWGNLDTPSDTGVDMSIAEVFTRTASIKRASGPFNMPTQVAVSSGGRVLVSDGYGNARIHELTGDGEVVGSWGTPGPGPGQFWLVHHVAISSDDRVFVCDRENERVQIFDIDGQFLAQWEAQRPASVAATARGGCFVGELSWSVGSASFRQGRVQVSAPARISEFDSTGRLVGRIGGDGVGADIALQSPHGIAVDSTGSLYVADVAVTPKMPAPFEMIYKLTPSAAGGNV